jgi:bacterioferritin-associated ferredoxin
MIVCSCNVLSDHEIQNVVTAAGAQTPNVIQVYACLGCTMQCGRCARRVKCLIGEALRACPARTACGIGLSGRVSTRPSESYAPAARRSVANF